MAFVIKSILGIPGWFDIWQALVGAVIIVFITAVLNLFFPNTTVAEFFSFIMTAFIIILSLGMILVFTGAEVLINFFGPMIYALFNWALEWLNGFRNLLFGWAGLGGKPMRITFNPVSLLGVTRFFAELLINITGIGNSDVSSDILGSTGLGAGLQLSIKKSSSEG